MLLIALAAAAVHVPLPSQWAQFSRSGVLSHSTETVDIAAGNQTGPTRPGYLLRYTRSMPGQETEIKWANSGDCPTIRTVIVSMQDIAMPSPAPYGAPGQSVEIILDGAEYLLTAPSSYSNGRLTITSNVGSALATWVDSSLKQLAPCWKKEPMSSQNEAAPNR